MAQIGTHISTAAKHLSDGQNVAIPTETVYGLAGNALDQDAVLRIFAIKNRPKFDPLIVHTHSLEAIAPFVSEIPETTRHLLEVFSPGPLTVVLPKKPIISDLVTSGLSHVAVRIPQTHLTLALLKALPFPLAAPSANPFTYVSPTTAAHVQQQLGDKIPYILDGGPCDVGIESTIVREYADHLAVLRLGGLSLEDLAAHSQKPVKLLSAHEDGASPGSFKKHYATKTPLYLNWQATELPADQQTNLAYLRFAKPIEGIPLESQFILASDGQISTAARNLFSLLRALDSGTFSAILAETLPNEGLGKAVNDRLMRAMDK